MQEFILVIQSQNTEMGRLFIYIIVSDNLNFQLIFIDDTILLFFLANCKF